MSLRSRTARLERSARTRARAAPGMSDEELLTLIESAMLIRAECGDDITADLPENEVEQLAIALAIYHGGLLYARYGDPAPSPHLRMNELADRAGIEIFGRDGVITYGEQWFADRGHARAIQAAEWYESTGMVPPDGGWPDVQTLWQALWRAVTYLALREYPTGPDAPRAMMQQALMAEYPRLSSDRVSVGAWECTRHAVPRTNRHGEVCQWCGKPQCDQTKEERQ